MTVSAVVGVGTVAECITGMRAVARWLTAGGLRWNADAAGNGNSESVVEALLARFISSKMALNAIAVACWQ